MAWCPFAERHPVALRDSQRNRIRPVGLVLHTAVSNSSLVVPTGTTRWHFYCARDGKLTQFFDTEHMAAAQLDGNEWYEDGEYRGFVSVETWDGAGSDVWPDYNSNHSGGPAWTPAQLASLAQLGAWLHEVHGIPLREADGPRGSGIGYHRQFNSGSLVWTRSHACPGNRRIAQVPGLIEAMKVSAPTHTADWLTMATPDEVRDAVRGVVREEIREVLLNAKHAQVGNARDTIAHAAGAASRDATAALKVLRDVAVKVGVEVDEEELAAALAPLLVVNVGGLSDADVAAIAKATNDELARRASA